MKKLNQIIFFYCHIYLSNSIWLKKVNQINAFSLFNHIELERYVCAVGMLFGGVDKGEIARTLARHVIRLQPWWPSPLLSIVCLPNNYLTISKTLLIKKDWPFSYVQQITGCGLASYNSGSCPFMKVTMDGEAYEKNVDLRVYSGY